MNALIWIGGGWVFLIFGLGVSSLIRPSGKDGLPHTMCIPDAIATILIWMWICWRLLS